jgi:eukaryotic-like serine/threonine-protein kinase
MFEITPTQDDSAEGGTSSDAAPSVVPTWEKTTLDVRASGRLGAAVEAAGAARGGLGPAARIGRYSVLRELGRGGMGVTYVAYDEELDRKVAIKLVRSDIIDEQAQTRLQREARALARLAHPNIVTVHDVGTHESHAFIAMEFVPGQTLSAWLAERPRSYAEVLAVFRQAGEGLRAAHEAGLVHRDVKPANVIVGDDGRVRVLDFGLARRGVSGGAVLEGFDAADGEAAVWGPRADSGGVDARLTQAGVLMGTLAYMAPEQLAEDVADERSDQFSLCVSLFDALYQREPFSGATPRERLLAMRRGGIAPVPENGPVPAWLHAVVVRGLSYFPDQRWPSLEALLAALEPAPPPEVRAKSRPRLVLAAAAAVLALGGAALASGLVGARDESAVCSGAPAQIAEVWGPPQRAAVEQAMRATGVPYAADTWQRSAALLDRYAADWAAAHTDACEATAVRAEQSEAVLDQRMGCLARARRNLRALVGELARLDAASIASATEAAGHLPRVAACADLESLGGRLKPPADPGVAAQVETIETSLERAAQLQELGKYEEARGLTADAVATSAALDYAPLEARARVQLGTLQIALGAYEAAEASLKDGHLLARTAADHETTLRAATQLVHLQGHLMSRLDGAVDWERHVRAELPWVSSEAEQASALNTLGVLALLQGQHERAMELCVRALALWQQELGPDHPEGAKALTNLGLVFHMQGKYEQAAEHHRRVLAIGERTLGAEHPRMTFLLTNLAGALYLQGKPAEAIEHYTRALSLAEKSWGPDHPYVADPPLTGLALSYVDEGRAAEAVALAERGLAVLAKHETPPEGMAEARFALARALAATGREPARVLALARQARDAMRASPGGLSLIPLADIEAWLRPREPHRPGAP